MKIGNGFNIKRATVSARIRRADGTVEELGIIDSYDRNILRHLFDIISRRIKRWRM